MPGFDETGPRGQGQGSGWGMGPCGGGSQGGFGRGGGRASGGCRPGGGFRGRACWGRSRGYGPYGSVAGPRYGIPQDEAQALKAEAAYLKGELEVIQKRLAELEEV
jgi:hypothetical protein